MYRSFCSTEKQTTPRSIHRFTQNNQLESEKELKANVLIRHFSRHDDESDRGNLSVRG